MHVQWDTPVTQLFRVLSNRITTVIVTWNFPTYRDPDSSSKRNDHFLSSIKDNGAKP